MKAISLWQPWATLVALGAKQWETRHWPLSYRGPLLIHAAQRWRDDQIDALIRNPIIKRNLEAGFKSRGLMELTARMPLGAYVAIVNLTRVIRTDGSDNGGKLLGTYPAG